MRYFTLHFISIVLTFFIGCAPREEKLASEVFLIPKPTQMKLGEGSFTFDKSTTIASENEFSLASDFLRSYIQNGAGLIIEETSKEATTILIEKDTSQPKDGYTLDVSEESISIKASDAGGAFYAIQSLRQLMPAQLERKNSNANMVFSIPVVSIVDAPTFPYRGMHLDVGRHFFSKEFIKKYISNLALLKMNYFHWHLTEDQGWRIEIKNYPKLTTHAAYRDETLVGHYNETPQQYDGIRYGGFYTQEDVKEIVAFAKKLNVTIIPEIEMPGHAQAAVSAYPELGCTGEQVPVATKWGVFENIYCPNKKTFTFLKDVLTEVIELFPGEYIHIGGDEAPKAQWKNCGHCQKLIRDLNLKDEHGLQSYFIKEIEVFLNNKGKKIIGWDEILEGGLAPNATVMSWRGTQGGIEAAKAKHDVIMTPTSHAYFDYYQADDSDEPLAIGGFLPLKKVYSFNPIPEELTIDEAKYILGAQGNVWTEYMPTEDQVEYMAFPRTLAMSELVWSGASENIETDYPDFLSRLEPFMQRLEALDINYANHLYEIEGQIIKKDGKVFYELKTPTSGKELRYSLNTAKENKYTSPIPITEDADITANVYKNGKKVGKTFSENILKHKGVTATIALNKEPHKAYNSGGKEAVINGIRGSDSRYGDKEWLGFWGDDLEITIDFEKETEVNLVSLRFYNANGQWIYAPKQITITTEPKEGKSESQTQLLQSEDEQSLIAINCTFDRILTSRITILIPNYGDIPDGHQGAGNKAWTFIDEIIIE